MEAAASRIRLSLHPLIAEAKRRTRQRRVLVLLVAAAVVATLLLTVPSWGRGDSTLGVVASNTAIAQIPGMTRVAAGGTVAMGTCRESIGPGGHYPRYCSLKPSAGRYEQWILTSAYEQGYRWNVQVPFATAHPGPVMVIDDWARFASPRDLALYMSEPDLGGRTCSNPVPGVNGGTGCSTDAGLAQVGTPKERVSQRDQSQTGRAFWFTWTSGTAVVWVSVSGVGLTLGEARPIALLAHAR